MKAMFKMKMLKPYPTYKDLGVEWLRKVPEGWEVKPGRALFREIINKGYVNEYLLSVTIAKGVILQAELLSQTLKKDSSNEDKSTYKLVEPGDIVYNKMRAWQGAVGVSTYRGLVSPAYIVQRLRDPKDFPRYFHYLLRTPHFAKEAERWSYGITSDQWSLRSEDFKRIVFPHPPRNEQRAIVKFLDWADRRIKLIIAARKKRIRLLVEYRQTLINGAVTGKFDVRTGKPYPAYKDSGVEWLGLVPEWWEVRRLKSLASITMGQSPTSGKYLTEPQALPFLQGCAEFGERHPIPKQFHTTPTKIARSKSILLSVRAPVGGLNWADRAYGIGRGLAALAPYKKQVHPYFLWYYLISKGSEELQTTSTGSTYDAVSYRDIGNLSVLFPSLPEQRAIAEYLDRETKKINAAIEKTKKSIELWEELRTTLISDVVTGKLDVREAAEKLPEEEPELEAKIEAIEASLRGGEVEAAKSVAEEEAEAAEETA